MYRSRSLKVTDFPTDRGPYATSYWLILLTHVYLAPFQSYEHVHSHKAMKKLKKYKNSITKHTNTHCWRTNRQTDAPSWSLGQIIGGAAI